MTLEEFFVLLKTSHLLRPEQFALLRGDIARLGPNITAQQVADRLVQQNLLTPWQSEQLLVHGWNGFRVGNYTLTEQIGKGGMGAVFKAEHSVMGRTVAVKVLSKTRLDNPSAIQRFRREVKAAAALDHPNIIVAHDAGQVGDVHYLVMEYVEGRDLNAWLQEFGTLPIQWACEFTRQAALGLEHAWQKGMVHRDIKPANLLVLWNDRDRPPVVKILDMGLARFTQELVDEIDEADRKQKNQFDSADGHLTQVGQILGTPDYLAPEQIERTHSVDIRADIFSLGCTLFKLLAGALPFGGDTVMEKLQARIDRSSPPAPAISTFRPDAPPRLDQILARMLERDPERRYQNPGEVAHDLSLLGYEQHWTRELPTVSAGTENSHEASSIALEAPAQLLPKPTYQPGAFKEEADSGTRAFLSHLAKRTAAEYGESTEDFGAAIMPPLVTGGPSPDYEPAAAAPPPFASPVSAAPQRAHNPHLARRRQLRRRQSAVAMVVAGVATVVVGIGLMYVVAAGMDRIRNQSANHTPIPLDVPLPPAPPPDDPDGPAPGPGPSPRRNGNLLHVFAGHEVGVPAVALSSRYVVSGGMDGLVKVWHQQSGDLERTFSGHERWVNCAAITPSGKLIATGGLDTKLRLWSIDGSSRDALSGHEAAINQLRFSPGGGSLLSGDVEGNVLLWAKGRGEALQSAPGQLLALGFVPLDGDDEAKVLPVGLYSRDQLLTCWDLVTAKTLFHLENLGSVRAASFSANGQWLVCGDKEGVVHVINTVDHKVDSFPAHSGWVLCAAISDDGEIVASGGQDQTVYLRHRAVSRGQRYRGHTASVLAVALSPDGRTLASGSKDATVRLWYVPPAGELDP